MKNIGCISLLVLALAGVCAGQSREAIERTHLSVLQNYYATQDPNYANVVARLPEIETALNQLRDRITAAQAARPGQFASEVSNCLQAVNTALRRTVNAGQQTEVPQYGNVRALVSIPGENDENRLEKVLQCTGQLNALLGRDPAIAEAASRLQVMTQQVQEPFDQIDDAAARRKAKAALRRA